MATEEKMNCFVCASPLPCDTVTPPDIRITLEEFCQWTLEFTQSEGNTPSRKYPGIFVCSYCEAHVQSAVERTKAVEETEALVRRLQLQLLAELRQLQRRLQELYGDMRWIGDRISNTSNNEARSITAVNPAGGLHSGAPSFPREAVLKALRNLETFRRDPTFLVESEVKSESASVKDNSSGDDDDDGLFQVEAELQEIDSSGDEEALLPLETSGGDPEKRRIPGAKDKHQKRRRRPDKAKPCPICGRPFQTRTHLAGHLINVHLVEPEGPVKYRCPTCGLCSQSKSMYAKHLEAHGRPGLKERVLLPCRKCKRKLVPRFYKDHMAYCTAAPVVSNEGESPSQNPHRPPPRARKAPPSLSQMTTSEAPGNGIPPTTSAGGDLVCEFCGRLFGNEKTLRKHLAECRDQLQGQYQCDMCAVPPFLNLQGLQLHRKRHLTNGKRPHVCERCGGDFLRLYHLRRHQTLCDGTKKPRKPRYSNMTQPVAEIPSETAEEGAGNGGKAVDEINPVSAVMEESDRVTVGY